MDDLFTDAVIFAAQKHRGQKYPRAEQQWPFLVHPLGVALQFEDSLLRIIAVLHDVVEDTDATLDDLEQFGPRVQEAVGALTRNADENYSEYIERLATNLDAAKVKVADLRYNIEHCCRSDAPRWVHRLLTRYGRALAVLVEALAPTTEEKAETK
jgi:guanosine-3',5'-bis(diphosphate) 3'-pyrophosphohydrolase